MILLLTIVTIIMSITTISIHAFVIENKAIKALIAVHPLISFVANFAISFFIMMFVGVGMIAGVSNLAASIIFTIYCLYYKKKNNIEMTKNEIHFKVPVISSMYLLEIWFFGWRRPFKEPLSQISIVMPKISYDNKGE